MKNKKLFLLLRALSEKELEHFSDFLESPFFNKNKKIVALWNSLKPYAPSFDEEELRTYSTYKMVYEHGPTLESAFRTMTMLVKDFLVQLRLQDEQFYVKHLLLDELLNKKIHKEYNSVYQSTIKRMAQPNYQKSTSFLTSFLIQYNYLEYLSQTNSKLTVVMEIMDNSLDILDKFYLFHKLILSAATTDLQKVGGIANQNTTLIPEIDEKIQAGWHADAPAIKTMHLCFRLINEGNDSDFFCLLDLLEENKKSLTVRQLNDVYILLTNHCTRRIREGRDFNPRLFSIYKDILENHSKGMKDYIPHKFFKNIATVGCRLQKYTETREIIRQYEHLIAPEFRTSAVLFNLGIVDYFEKNYEQAIERFTQAQTHKTIYSVEGQIILLKIYYLTAERIAFPPLLKALKARIRSAKFIGNQRKTGYKNFCKIILPMFKLKTEPNYRKRIANLRKMMLDYPSAGNMAWLGEQLDLLD